MSTSSTGELLALAERMRGYVQARGGPAKDDDGKYIGTCWPMILEAADVLDRLAATPKAGVDIRPLDWQETFVDRGDGSKDQSGWEADNGFNGWYSIEMYFGSDSYGWSVQFDTDVIGDFDDPDRAKAAAQKHFEQRISLALPSVLGGVDQPRSASEPLGLEAMRDCTGPSEANSPAAPVAWSDERLAELVQLIDWDTGLTIADEVRQLREVFKLAVLPAPVDAGVREALIDALAGLKYIEPAIPVLRTMFMTADLALGARKAEEMDASNKEAIKKLEAVLAALSSQPVVGVDQEEAPLRRTDR